VKENAEEGIHGGIVTTPSTDLISKDFSRGEIGGDSSHDSGESGVRFSKRLAS
jgi:hypothetical protein